MRTVFAVAGPLEAPFYQGHAGRTITDDNVRAFWDYSPHAESSCAIISILQGTPGWRPGPRCRL